MNGKRLFKCFSKPSISITNVIRSMRFANHFNDVIILFLIGCFVRFVEKET